MPGPTMFLQISTSYGTLAKSAVWNVFSLAFQLILSRKGQFNVDHSLELCFIGSSTYVKLWRELVLSVNLPIWRTSTNISSRFMHKLMNWMVSKAFLPNYRSWIRNNKFWNTNEQDDGRRLRAGMSSLWLKNQTISLYNSNYCLA